MTDETRQPWQTTPPVLQEQESLPGTGPLPDLPDEAYAPDAVPLDEPDSPAADDGSDPDQVGDFTDPDVDLAAVLPGWDDDPEQEEA